KRKINKMSSYRKIPEKIYLMYYFLIRKDKNFSKKGRTFLLIEIVFTMFFGLLLLILFGLINIKLNSTLRAIFLGISALLISTFFTKKLYSKGKDIQIIKNGEKYSTKERKTLIVIG